MKTNVQSSYRRTIYYTHIDNVTRLSNVITLLYTKGFRLGKCQTPEDAVDCWGQLSVFPFLCFFRGNNTLYGMNEEPQGPYYTAVPCSLLDFDFNALQP